MKYSKVIYNILNIKLLVFYDIYRKVYLLQEQYYNIYLFILLGQALEFYYNNFSSYRYNFNTIVRMTRTYFETAENC